MRLARLLIVASVMMIPLTPAFCPPPVAAQQAPATPLCTGNVDIVRVSDIKPGMMQQFLGAVAAQQAWYKNAGTPDEIYAMRIMEQNPDTKAYAFSEIQALTSHILSPGRKAPAHDAGFDAFVKMFQESSTIKNQYVTCFPKM